MVLSKRDPLAETVHTAVVIPLNVVTLVKDHSLFATSFIHRFCQWGIDNHLRLDLFVLQRGLLRFLDGNRNPGYINLLGLNTHGKNSLSVKLKFN